MAKKVAGLIRLQIKGDAANPSPPAGPTLGSKSINIMGFYGKFNVRTQDEAGKVISVIITYYTDKSFDSVLEAPPAAVQLKEMAKSKTASAQPNHQKVAPVTWDQVRTIAEDEMVDLNCFTAENVTGLAAGTTRSMGIIVKGEFPGNN